MSDITNTANAFRKSGDIDSALPLYRERWEATKDKFAAAGLLFCYRKKKMFSEALPLAHEAYAKYSGFDWVRNEYIWTLIQGKLYTFPEDGQLSEMVSLVSQILDAKPDEIAYKITVFKLLKTAKKHGNWSLLNEWITRIRPDILTGYTDEETGWTDKVLWYYYRVNGLIHSGREVEAVGIIDNICGEFYKQKKYFQRLKAKAFISLNRLDEAIEVYNSLVKGKPDWWLLHEYGKLMLEKGNTSDGLAYFIRAAAAPPMKPELKVSLFSDIGSHLLQLGKKTEALPHFQLAKAIRQQKGWGIGQLDQRIEQSGGPVVEEKDVKLLLKACESIWEVYLPKHASKPGQHVKRGLTGKIVNLRSERPFCFIKAIDGTSYFCSKSELPEGAANDQRVRFDIKPSFDRSKNKETFKAINISFL